MAAWMLTIAVPIFSLSLLSTASTSVSLQEQITKEPFHYQLTSTPQRQFASQGNNASQQATRGTPRHRLVAETVNSTMLISPSPRYRAVSEVLNSSQAYQAALPAVPVVNMSQNSASQESKPMGAPQVFYANATRTQQVDMPRDRLTLAPTPHQVIDRMVVSKQPQSTVSTSSQLQNSNLVFNNSSADQRLFWHPGHKPDCPNHPHHPPHPPESPRCGGVFAGEITLRSPGSPGPYPPGVECRYTVLPTAPVLPRACFRVSFVHVALRWSPNCQQDWLQIDQGPRLCGGLSGDKYYQTPGNLNVQFHTGPVPGPQGSGFHIIVSQIPCHIIDPPTPTRPPYLPPPQPRPPYHPHPEPPHICPPEPHPPHKPPLHPNHKPPFYPLYKPTFNTPQNRPIFHALKPPIFVPQYKPSLNHEKKPPHFSHPLKPPVVYHPVLPVRPNSFSHEDHDNNPFWWRWYRVLKCEWSGVKNLPPGLCPPPHETHHEGPVHPNYVPPRPQQPYYPPPPPHETHHEGTVHPNYVPSRPQQPYYPPPPPHETHHEGPVHPNYVPPGPQQPYYPPPPYVPSRTPPPPTNVPSPRPPLSDSCGRTEAEPDFVVSSEEWLPRRSPQGFDSRPWSCQLTVLKATPGACEVYLELQNMQLRCGAEFLEIAGQRVCGSQPRRQLNVDFRGPEVRIVYHNLAGDTSPGNFVIRGFQNFDCDPLILDVTPVKRLQAPPPTTPRSATTM